MRTFIGWLAVAGVLYFAYFIVKRLLRFLLRRSEASTPHHVELADAAEDIAAASKVAAMLSTAVAFFLAPVGLMGFGAALGFVSVPVIVKLAPILIGFAAAAGGRAWGDAVNGSFIVFPAKETCLGIAGYLSW
jgi:hypothetical protein